MREVLRMGSREKRGMRIPTAILSQSRKEREGLQKTKINQPFFGQDEQDLQDFKKQPGFKKSC
jgi:hypothetical protein